MGWVQPGGSSTVVFLAIVVGVVYAIISGLRVSTRMAGGDESSVRAVTLRASLFFVVVLAASGVYVGAGIPRRGLPQFMAFFAVSNLVAVALALSPVGRRLTHLAPRLLIAPHALRLPLELVLHDWAQSGVIPVQMTFEGHNFDIVTGVLAFALASQSRNRALPRAVVWFFAVVGMGFLLVVMTVALLSSPIPLNAYGGQRLELVFHLPYAWILPMCVSPALFGHLVLFRQLLTRPS